MENQLFYIFSAGLLGLGLGALFMYFLSGKSTSAKKSIQEVEEKLNDYQQNVVEHFEQTADLVDELTQSYKKVFDHLGKSAKQLMTDEQVQQQIEKRKGNKITLGFLTEEEDNHIETKNDDITVNEEVENKEPSKENHQENIEEQDVNELNSEKVNKDDDFVSESDDLIDETNKEEGELHADKKSS